MSFTTHLHVFYEMLSMLESLCLVHDPVIQCFHPSALYCSATKPQWIFAPFHLVLLLVAINFTDALCIRECLFSGSRVLSPVTVTASNGTAIHQLPPIITKPQIIVSNPGQVILNGPAIAGTTLTNGTHLEIKKENADFSQGKYCQS